MGSSQRGVALITVLLIVALATTVAVAMTARQQYDIRRAGNLLHAEQAGLYLQGAEAWAAQVLRRDREEGEIDHLFEDWANVLPPIPIDGGQISGVIEDRQGRFNLNNLWRHGRVDDEALAQLRRLLIVLSLDPALAEAIADWVDADINTRFPGGAEDDHYLGLTPAYRSANRPLQQLGELRLVHGIDREVFETLAPHLTALPTRTRINVNTATAEVLASLADELSLAAAVQLVADRGEDGYGDLGSFLQHPVLAGIELDDRHIGLASEYFVLRPSVQFGRLSVSWQSLLQRDEQGHTRVVQRSLGNL